MATSTLGSGTLVLAGTTSGTTTVTATAVAGTTTLTLPAATDTLVGKATTDTLTNKTLTGAAMNGTVGATTPSTGAFTTLTSTSASSFATSSGNVGIGTSSPSVKLHASTSGAGIQEVEWLNNSQAVGADVGSAMVFTGTSSNNGLARISGAFAGATTSDGAYMAFSSRAVTTGALTERARFNSTGALVFAGGTTGADGIGITFPATQSASSDANTLDDYEEGTYATTFSSPVNLTGTPALGKGRYTKVGRLVSIQGEVTGYSITTANTLTYFVMTLPFVTVSNTEAFSGSVTEKNSYSVGTILDSSSGSDNTIFLGFRAASVPSSGSATYHFSLTYMSS